ncbi:MAG TPA: AgmX/PglI C-terminal domain-containing protein [Myxococcales bacterium]|nr:AgmX/PglI C-terminal domain-containing protein [Myxococcales bacterium]
MLARRHPSARALEVAVRWGRTLLDVQTLAPGGPLQLGAHRLGIEGPGHVELGPLSLDVRWASPTAPLPAFEGVDLRFFELLAFAFAFHLALIIAVWMRPADDEGLSESLFNRPEILRAVVVRPASPDKFQVAAGHEGLRAPKPEGARGKPEALRERTAAPEPGSQRSAPRQRELDRQRVLRTGLLAGLGALDILGNRLDGAHGGGPLGDAVNRALEGLRGGVAMEDAHGVHGLGIHGLGPGGGGPPVGLGGLGTVGRGGGPGGDGLLDFGGPGKAETRVRPGPTIVDGALSKEVVGAIVRKHWHEIRYCYEMGLSRNPSLYGKVAVAFTIDGTGGVAEAAVSESTLGDVGVERCVTERVRRWRFPEPRGGGQVYVNYPWVLRSSGE